MVPYGPSSVVNDSEADFQAPLCFTYTSVTTKGLVTSLPLIDMSTYGFVPWDAILLMASATASLTTVD